MSSVAGRLHAADDPTAEADKKTNRIAALNPRVSRNKKGVRRTDPPRVTKRNGGGGLTTGRESASINSKDQRHKPGAT
jgi:hypothetical protein